MDANLPMETLSHACEKCSRAHVPVWYNPTDYRKCDKIVQVGCLSRLTYLSPNYKELVAIFKSSVTRDPNERGLAEWSKTLKPDDQRLSQPDTIENLERMLKYLLKHVPVIVVSRGERDLVLATRYSIDINARDELPTARTHAQNSMTDQGHDHDPHMCLFPTVELAAHENISNVSGAGDTLLAGLVAGLLNRWPLVECVYNGLLAAHLSLQTNACISDQLGRVTRERVQQAVRNYRSRIKIYRLE